MNNGHFRRQSTMVNKVTKRQIITEPSLSRLHVQLVVDENDVCLDKKNIYLDYIRYM